jgi:hypothetical protein
MLLVQEKESTATESRRNPMAIILDRKLSIADLELKGLEAVASEEASRDLDTDSLITQKLALEEKVEKLRAEASRLASFQVPTTSISDVLLDARKKRDEQKKQLGNVQDAIEAAEQSAEDARRGAAEADGKIAQKEQERYELLRFPKEGAMAKKPYWVILRHEKAYFVFDENQKENRDDIEWEVLGDSAKLTPIPTKGHAVVPSTNQPIIDLSKIDHAKFYLAICIYPDSYGIWRKFRSSALQHQLQYGLTFESPNGTLTFGSRGTAPKPL